MNASASRWIRIKAIVADAIDLAPESRPAWVERACGGDPVLRSASPADAANVNTRSHVASNSEGLGHAHVALASNRSLAHDARLGHWREAKARFHDSYVFWKEMRDKGITTGADAARPEALALEIAKCDAALGAGPTTRERR